MEIMLANNLRQLRIQSKRTLEEVAQIIDVSRQSVSKWENGECYPDIEKCFRLAKLYHVTLDALVSEPMCFLPEKKDKNGKYMFGVAQIDESGALQLPEQVLSVFDITPEDTLVILGDTGQGIAIIKSGHTNQNHIAK